MFGPVSLLKIKPTTNAPNTIPANATGAERILPSIEAAVASRHAARLANVELFGEVSFVAASYCCSWMDAMQPVLRYLLPQVHIGFSSCVDVFVLCC